MKNSTIVKAAVVIAIIVLAFLFYTRPAHAADAKPQVVNEMESTAGESKDDFLVRVATFMLGWSYSTGDESCGIIAQQNDRYSVIVTTLNSQVMCDSALIYSGWTATGDNIHSHPVTNASGKIKLTSRTKELANGALDDRDYIVAKRRVFSTGDYMTGPGYLVDNGVLLYQHGLGTQRKIADIQNLAALAAR